MRDPSLASSNYFLRTCIQKTENSLRRKRIPITAGKVLSDQMFGFWLAFFVSHNYMLVGGQPIYAFPHKPRTENRASIHRKLEEVKNFRNRMNHCEPLCFRGNVIDCTNSFNVRTTLYDLVRWIDPALESYFREIDAVSSKIARIIRI
jgi:hypothetical protein